MRSGPFIAAIVAGLAAIAPAQAGVTILGPSLAAQCSQVTRFGRADTAAVELCDAALKDVMSTYFRAGTYVNRGILHLRRNEFDLARADFEAAMARAPEVGEVWVNRGALLIITKHYAEGLADTNRALELGVEEPEKAYYNRGIAYEGLNDAAAAYHDYQHALELKPDWEMPKRQLTRFTVIRSGQ